VTKPLGPGPAFGTGADLPRSKQHLVGAKSTWHDPTVNAPRAHWNTFEKAFAIVDDAEGRVSSIRCGEHNLRRSTYGLPPVSEHQHRPVTAPTATPCSVARLSRPRWMLCRCSCSNIGRILCVPDVRGTPAGIGRWPERPPHLDGPPAQHNRLEALQLYPTRCCEPAA
jgi:hypothetical protein